MDFFDGFVWAVPAAFADPLEKCRFERGDVFHDDPAACDGPWSAARAAKHRTLQVRLPEQGEVGRAARDADSIFADNWRRSAEVLLFAPGETEPREIPTTQGRLYTCLWRGDDAVLDLSTPEPPVPLAARDLRDDLDTAAARLAAAADATDGCLFVTLFDHAASLSRKKDHEIRAALEACSGCEAIAHPVDRDDARPTLRWMAYHVPGLDETGVTELLKPALYRPQGDREGKTDRFDLKRHGRLVALSGPRSLF